MKQCLNQRGIGHILLILFLLISIGVAVYLVQTKTNLFPKANQQDQTAQTISQLTKQLVSESQQLQPKTGSLALSADSVSSVDRIKSVALKRKTELAKVAKSDPAAFLKLTTLLGQENKLAQEVSQDVEKQIEVKGVLKAFHGDDFTSKKSGPIEYYLDNPTINRSSYQTQTPKFYKVGFVKPPLSKLIGKTVTINGVALDKDLVTETGDISGKSFNLKVDNSVLGVTTDIFGEQKVGVFLLNFQNDTREVISKNDVKNLMFMNSDSVDSYYRQNSFNKASVTGDVYGYFTLPPIDYSAQFPCDYYTWALQADQLITQSGIDLSQFKYRVYALFPGPCPYGGLGEIGGPGMTFARSWIFYPGDVGIYKHELGHNLGVHHANALNYCPDSLETDYSQCFNEEYGDITDTMGYGMNQGFQFNLPHKIAVGWVPTTRVINSPVTGTYTIYNSESDTTLPQALRINTPYFDPIYNLPESYFVSYRQAIGFDISLPSTITRGVSVHLWDELPSVQTKLIDVTKNSPNGMYDATLQDGSEAIDPRVGLKIKQLSHDSQKAVVEITNGGFPHGSITADSITCIIPFDSPGCSTKIQWVSQSTTTTPTIKIRETGEIFATGASGSKQTAPFLTDLTFDLYDGSNLLGSVTVTVGVLPPAPTIIKNVSCINDNYQGDGVVVRWTNPSHQVAYASIQTTGTAQGGGGGEGTIIGYKFVGGVPATETTAPNGFTYIDGAKNILNFSLIPDVTYGINIINNIGTGPISSFSLPRCSTETPPPTATPTPTSTPTPTPSTTPKPTPSPTPVACNPRPNIGRSVSMGPQGLTVTLTAATNANTPNNPISSIGFTKFDNGTVAIDNLTKTAPFDYLMPVGTNSVSFLIKQVTKGVPTTIQLKVNDTCGPYSLFFGGGTSAGWPSN